MRQQFVNRFWLIQPCNLHLVTLGIGIEDHNFQLH